MCNPLQITCGTGIARKWKFCTFSASIKNLIQKKRIHISEEEKNCVLSGRGWLWNVHCCKKLWTAIIIHCGELFSPIVVQ